MHTYGTTSKPHSERFLLGIRMYSWSSIYTWKTGPKQILVEPCIWWITNSMYVWTEGGLLSKLIDRSARAVPAPLESFVGYSQVPHLHAHSSKSSATGPHCVSAMLTMHHTAYHASYIVEQFYLIFSSFFWVLQQIVFESYGCPRSIEIGVRSRRCRKCLSCTQARMLCMISVRR